MSMSSLAQSPSASNLSAAMAPPTPAVLAPSAIPTNATGTNATGTNATGTNATGTNATASAAETAFSAPNNATPLPTRITRYRISPDKVPVDFFADPDGAWEFASLVEMAGFNPEHPGASVGALTQAFDGYPEGAAVVTEVGAGCQYVAVAQLPPIPLESKRRGSPPGSKLRRHVAPRPRQTRAA